MSSASNPRNSNSGSAAAAAAVLNAKLGGPSCGDPYEILGLERSATTVDIQKKTRKLLLTCHPDKRRADSNHVQLDKLFHDIQEVKDFLLNDTKRKKYDAAWKAEQERWTRLDAKRQKHLSVFEASLERAAANKKKKKRKTTSQSYSTPEDDPIHRMKRANQQRRDDFYNQQQQQQQNETRDTKKSKTKPTDSSSFAYKQVKLKWSRKKLSASFLESDVLQYLNTKFPTVLVQTLELLGKKGNMALVTLQNSSDCKILVDGLLQSDEMRATKVLAEEVVEDEELLKDHHQKYSNETLKETMLRREAERESLLRRMEMEEMTSNHNPKGPSNFNNNNNNNNPSSDFPPRFPTHSDDDNTIYSPLQRLEKEEIEILKSYLSPDAIQAIQIRTK